MSGSRFFFFSSRRRHTRYWRDWSSDVCSSDLFPEDLTSFDSQLQLALRGHLPEGLTQFFKGITVAGNVSTQAVIVAVAVLALLALSWRAEALFVLSNGV